MVPSSFVVDDEWLPGKSPAHAETRQWLADLLIEARRQAFQQAENDTHLRDCLLFVRNTHRQARAELIALEAEYRNGLAAFVLAYQKPTGGVQ
jgi:hypothetical protein